MKKVVKLYIPQRERRKIANMLEKIQALLVKVKNELENIKNEQ